MCIPLYQAVSNLDTIYQFKDGNVENATVAVQANTHHATLFKAEQEYREIYKLKYTPSIANINIATARLSVLYTDTSREEGYLGEDVASDYFEMLVRDNEAYTVTSKNFYKTGDTYMVNRLCSNKALRAYDFNSKIEQRIAAFASLQAPFDKNNVISTVADFSIAKNKGNFHETFHHSEQAIMSLMDQTAWQDDLIKSVRLSDKCAVYIYGFVLDIFTTRNLCNNCNVGLIGLQNSKENGFLNTISRKFSEANFETREKGLMLSTRVSCNTATKGSSLAPMQRVFDPNFKTFNPDTDQHIVMQALSSKLDLAKEVVDSNLTLKDYEGHFFMSRKISHLQVDKHILVRLKGK